jgi:short-subunit dehydrogenase
MWIYPKTVPQPAEETMKTLKDKTAVITGAGSGIGRALAQALAQEGARLALADKDPAGLKETLSLLQGTPARTWKVDVSRRKEVEGFSRKAKQALGPADIVVNNAGVNSFGLVADTRYETMEWMMGVNLWGTVYMTKAFLPQLLGRPESSLVNVSSTLGLLGFYGQAAYSASKFAVRGFSEALGQELKDTSVTVTLVFPGGVKTGIHQASRNEYRLSKADMESGRKEIEAHLKSTPDQAAKAIVNGIKRGSPRVLVGMDAHFIDRLARWLPSGQDLFVDRVKRKDPFWRQIQAGSGKNK